MTHDKMTIILSPFKQVLASLIKGIERASREPDDLEVRDACIQRFEYTYELSIRTIKRYIEQEMPFSEQIDQLNFRDLLRIAFEAGLVEPVEPWFQYREARNQTSHAYDQKKAAAVFQIIPSFITSTEFLLEQLTQRIER